jgi:hypothetical protein
MEEQEQNNQPEQEIPQSPIVEVETSSNKLTLSLSVVLVVILLVGGYLWLSQPWESTPPLLSQSGCTIETRQCPDGSYVERMGPNCEFKECPTTKIEKFCSSNCGVLVQPNDIPVSEIKVESVVAGNFRGYYKEEGRYSESGNPEICRQLVITEGHSGLVEYFMNYIAEGNGVNTISSDGYLTINLPWYEFSESVQNQIINSSFEDQVDVLLFKDFTHASHASSCGSFFTIFDPLAPKG